MACHWTIRKSPKPDDTARRQPRGGQGILRGYWAKNVLHVCNWLGRLAVQLTKTISWHRRKSRCSETNYKCLHGIAPAYLTEMLVLKSTVPALSRLRSTARGDLLVPRTKTKTIGPRSFATSGPALWNKLPDDLRDPSQRLLVFKQRLKSYLFKQCWCALQPELTIAATCVSVNAFAFFCEQHRFYGSNLYITLHYKVRGHMISHMTTWVTWSQSHDQLLFRIKWPWRTRWL